MDSIILLNISTELKSIGRSAFSRVLIKSFQSKISKGLFLLLFKFLSSNLPQNPKLVWHPACLIKEWVCVDLSMDTLHLKHPLVLFGSEGSALTLPLFLLSPRIITLYHCSPTITKDHFLLISYGTK